MYLHWLSLWVTPLNGSTSYNHSIFRFYVHMFVKTSLFPVSECIDLSDTRFKYVECLSKRPSNLDSKHTSIPFILQLSIRLIYCSSWGSWSQSQSNTYGQFRKASWSSLHASVLMGVNQSIQRKERTCKSQTKRSHWPLGSNLKPFCCVASVLTNYTTMLQM